ILAGLRDNVAAATGRRPFVSVGRRFQGRKALKQFVAASPILKHILAKSPNQIWSEASLYPLKYAALAGTRSLRLLPLADAESPKAQLQAGSRANTPQRPLGHPRPFSICSKLAGLQAQHLNRQANSRLIFRRGEPTAGGPNHGRREKEK